MAYCKTIKFTTSYLGESIKSIMTCDAQKMRAMLVENKKYTLDEIWDAIVAYTTDVENENEHYFEIDRAVTESERQSEAYYHYNGGLRCRRSSG